MSNVNRPGAEPRQDGEPPLWVGADAPPRAGRLDEPAAYGPGPDTRSSDDRPRDRRIRGGGRVLARLLVPLDVAAVCLASYVAISLRDDRLVAIGAIGTFFPVVGLLLICQIGANRACGLYATRWRHASLPDLERIAIAALAGPAVAAFAFYASSAVTGRPWIAGFPRSFWILQVLLTGAAFGGLRLSIRLAYDRARRNPMSTVAGEGNGRATLLYGAGHTGVTLARSALRNPLSPVRPVGFLDDDPTLAGGMAAGIPIFGGIDALRRAAAETSAKTLLITMPDAPGSVIRRAVDAAVALGLHVRTVPGIDDLLDGSIDAYRVRHVRVEDLLRRPAVRVRDPAVQALFRDRVVLVTGAAGSIGSELARQVFAIGPRRLILLDRAESPLYLIQRELERRRTRDASDAELRVILGNVASRGPMERLISSEAPDVILHAAAYKHVPLLEDHPSDAVHVNVGGTSVLLDAAANAGVQRFVFVSTDKAVRPSSVMGATKRVAEALVTETARRTGRPYVSVRFGNVLGSTGSVVPIFQEQLEHGEALTITDPAMTRFFMTIPEAAWLILDAAAIGDVGDLFVLDMGEPVRVVDLARDLVRLSGRDPEGQPIEIVGLRPGEKLHEELFYDAERIRPTRSPRVLRAVGEPPPDGIREAAKSLLAMADGEQDERLRTALFDLVARYADGPLDAAAAPARALDEVGAVFPAR